MLTDIFSRRYEKRQLFAGVGQRELRLLVQTFRLVDEQVLPFFVGGNSTAETKATWKDLHDRLSMELGVKQLSPRMYQFQPPVGPPRWESFFMNKVCENFITEGFKQEYDPDVFMKIRLSFVELAFREREAQIAKLNSRLPAALTQARFEDRLPSRPGGGLRVPGTPLSSEQRVQSGNDLINATFAAQVHELNIRFEQAGAPLNYHNGFIQITTDGLTQKQIDEPFWALVKEPKWTNVDTDMKEAIDLRDSGGRDPALYAAKALESTIKIICDQKGWTTGKEKGASDFLNHLESKANGAYVSPWERDLMQKFFSGVRNTLGHGPGGEPMPSLTEPQTAEAIELCMSWIKTLIARL